MMCPKCANEMIMAKATSHGDEYFYCRTCKKELSEMERPSPTAGPSHDNPSETMAIIHTGINKPCGFTKSLCYESNHFYQSYTPFPTEACNCGMFSYGSTAPVMGQLEAASISSENENMP